MPTNPTYTPTVPKPLKRETVCDPELGGLKHVLIQMEDEAQQARARLHGHGTSVYQDHVPGDICN